MIQLSHQNKIVIQTRHEGFTSVIPAFRKQRQANLCEFEGSLIYMVRSRSSRAAQHDSVSKQKHLNLHRKERKKDDR